MKNILAIETATNLCSVSLFLDGDLVKTKSTQKPRSHVQKLPLYVYDVLKENNIKISELDGIAISIGPGSYTGLRIGMSMAKGLAMSHDLYLLPVNTLISMNMTITNKDPYWICIHSHKNIVFAQKFERSKPTFKSTCISLSELDTDMVYGYGLEKISPNFNFNKISPCSEKIGLFALKYYKSIAKKDSKDICPIYLTEVDISD